MYFFLAQNWNQFKNLHQNFNNIYFSKKWICRIKNKYVFNRLAEPTWWGRQMKTGVWRRLFRRGWQRPETNTSITFTMRTSIGNRFLAQVDSIIVDRFSWVGRRIKEIPEQRKLIQLNEILRECKEMIQACDAKMKS